MDQILAALPKAGGTCCIVGHIRPDGDCIGSQVALALTLQRRGLQVSCWNQDPVPPKYAFLDPQQLVQPPRPGKRFDCVIATDCAGLDRLGTTAQHIQRRNLLLNIDHHVSNTRFGDLNWISPKESSTGEMLFSLLRHARWPIPPDVAHCLFAAISTDTGSFQFSATKPSTLQAAADLIRAGADVAHISREVYHSCSLPRLHLLKNLYRNLRLSKDHLIAYCQLPTSSDTRTQATPADTEGLIDHLRSIAPVKVACLFEITQPNLTRISLRSKDPHIDVNRIAAQFGGGGHPAAAGARIPGPPSSVQRRVLAAIRDALAERKPPCTTA